MTDQYARRQLVSLIAQVQRLTETLDAIESALNMSRTTSYASTIDCPKCKTYGIQIATHKCCDVDCPCGLNSTEDYV